jgi:hypothetical protein
VSTGLQQNHAIVQKRKPQLKVACNPGSELAIPLKGYYGKTIIPANMPGKQMHNISSDRRLHMELILMMNYCVRNRFDDIYSFWGTFISNDCHFIMDYKDPWGDTKCGKIFG